MTDWLAVGGVSLSAMAHKGVPPEVEHAFALEDRQQVMLAQTADSMEARVAFFEKRDPRWENK